MSFDQHTGVLSDALLDKSPEEVLGIFLKHFTPEVLVAAVTRSLQGCSEDKKIALRSILFDPLYWTNGEVNEKGAFELLNTLGFINSK